jgi:hypothetical protein
MYGVLNKLLVVAFLQFLAWAPPYVRSRDIIIVEFVTANVDFSLGSLLLPSRQYTLPLL